jgi:hypothetical protein
MELTSETVAALADATGASAPTASSDSETQRRRGPGRPKGLPKTGGRQKGARNWTHPEIRAELLDKSNALDVLAAIVRGDKLYAGPHGTVGKAGWRVPTLTQRLRALEIVLAKVVPDLKASELTGAGGAPLIPGPDADPASLARAVAEFLHDSGRNDRSLQALPLPAKPAVTPDDELPATAPLPADRDAPRIGERILIGDGGAQIIYAEIEGTGRRKWHCFDGFGQLHGLRSDRTAAEDFAATLPGPAPDAPTDINGAEHE